MEFILTSLGNAKGKVSVEGNINKIIDLRPEKTQLHIIEAEFSDLTRLSFSSEQGKLADSEDSLLFFGIKINPSFENFSFSGEFCLEQSEGIFSRLSGFGAFAIDTLSSENKGCRYRNMISAGAHRSIRFNEYTRGIRVISGYSDPKAETGGMERNLDASRECTGIPNPSELLPGETIRVEFQKTNKGFEAWLSSGVRTDHLSFPGCDFLMQQDETAIYAGFGVAGGIHVTVSDICIQTTPGIDSHTPTEELKNIVPDYPFNRDLVDTDSVKWQPSRQTIIVSPAGSPLNSGEEDSPLDLKTALSSVADGGVIILEDGIYSSDTSFIAPRRVGDTDSIDVLVCARNDKGAILDGTRLSSSVPVMIIAGDHWQLRGIVFRRGKGPGLFICGSNNKVERCEAYDNEDSGFLICTFPGTTKEDWPRNNLISSCTSHNNCDPAESNADGFGAKLSIGEGNRFVSCSAYYNIDDGFDFYSKATLGPIGAVTAENCIAYSNGYLSGEREHRKYSHGIGFKMGGENQPVRHIARYCVAHDNARSGFSTNSNPLTQMENLLSWNNGLKPAESNYVLKSGSEPDWSCSNLWTEKSWRTPKPVLMFLVPRTSGGGAEKIITSLASQMTEKYKVYLVTTVREDGVRGYDYSDDIEYINIYKRFDEKEVLKGKNNLAASLAGGLKTLLGLQDGQAVQSLPQETSFRFQIESVRRLKQELHVDCAVSFLNSANYINAMSKGDERCIISIRSCLTGPFAPADCRSKKGIKRIADACEAADVIIPVSRELMSYMIKEYGVPGEKLKTIYNFIDPYYVRKMCGCSIEDDLIRSKFENSSFTFISMGRLTEKKGQWHIIRAFRNVVDRHPGALLVIPGRDGKKSENVAPYLKTIINDNGLSDNVILPGFFDNPYPLLAKSDAYVMASFNEGFPNALVEAMAADLPAIACDCSSGPREILAPNTDFNHKAASLQIEKYGIIVPECSGRKLNTEPLEPEEQMLADAMLLMIENDELREKYSRAGRQRIHSFTKPDIISRWEAIIDHDN